MKKFIKRYSLFLITAALLFALGTAGFVNEKNRIISQLPEEISFEPEAVYVPKPTQTVVHEDESLPGAEKQDEEQSAPEEIIKEAETVADVPVVFSEPVSVGVSGGYTGNELIYSETMKDYRTHRGLDYKADEDTSVFAAASGTVSNIENDDYYGLTVTVDHGGGLESIYSSLGKCFVKVGDEVQRGDTIAGVGNSAKIEAADGAHLHFEVRQDGETVNPMDHFG